MKKTAAFLLCLALLLSLTACGSGVVATDVSLADIREEMIAMMGEEDPIRLSDDYLFVLYGIDPADFSEAAAFMISRDIFSDEAILVKAKDEDALARVKEMLDEHLAAIRDQSRDYDPASYAVVQKSKVETDGLYAWLLISSKQDELGTIFSAHRKTYSPEAAPVYTPVPTPEPTATPAPTPSPTPAAPDVTPTPEPTPLPYGYVPESERAEDSWWNDAIFIGNSVAKNMETYVTKQRMGDWPTCMGTAIFFTAGSYTYKNAADGSGNRPKLQGHTYSIEEAIAVSGAKKAFISLGQGDIVFFQRSIEETIGYVDILLKSIHSNTPDVTVYVLGMTPRASIFEDQYANSAMIQAFNEAVCECAIANDCYYINSFEALADADGCLPMECCSETYDGGIHLTDRGCELWLDYLYRHTTH